MQYNRGQPLSVTEDGRRLEAYQSKLSDAECAEKLGLTVRAFKSWRVRKRLLRMCGGARCSIHGHLLRVSPRHRRKDKIYIHPERSLYMSNHGYCVQCGEPVEIQRDRSNEI